MGLYILILLGGARVPLTVESSLMCLRLGYPRKWVAGGLSALEASVTIASRGEWRSLASAQRSGR